MLNNQPFSKPITAILSKAVLWWVADIILPVVCSKEERKFLSSPKSFLKTFGNSSPVKNLISSSSSNCLPISLKALKGSIIS